VIDAANQFRIISGKGRVMTRVKEIRTRLDWSQAKLGAYLGLAQPAVFRLELGAAEMGPVQRVLDQLEAALNRGDIESGIGPEDAMARVMALDPVSHGPPVSRSGPQAA
jgi:transcriptional regulator with XRE-family HTH domain